MNYQTGQTAQVAHTAPKRDIGHLARQVQRCEHIETRVSALVTQANELRNDLMGAAPDGAYANSHEAAPCGGVVGELHDVLDRVDTRLRELEHALSELSGLR